MKARWLEGKDADLFVVSFLILFLEVSLIRWVSTETRIFAYVNNLVLLACFLGIGVGCYFSRATAHLTNSLLALTGLLFVMTSPISISLHGSRLHVFKDIPILLSAFSDSLIWFQSDPKDLIWKCLIGMAATLVIFAMVTMIFIPLGQRLGQLLDTAKDRIAAYSLNVIASLLGIWVFQGLSFLYSPPWVWFGVCWFAYALLLRQRGAQQKSARPALIAALGVLGIMVLIPIFRGTTILWSPYQRLQVKLLKPYEMKRGYVVSVNDVGYMALMDLSDSFTRAWPQIFGKYIKRFNQYELPYEFSEEPEDVLIVGAGGGNDVAGAIRQDVQRITAVEIDPGIYRIGRQFHPEAPYADPRVQVVIDDARAFFKKSDQRFDVIAFGLLDAHTLSSAHNNMRIDHYVYTQQSLREARELLKEKGILTLIFEAQRTWLADRLHGLLHTEFGHPPLTFWVRSDGWLGWGGLMFVASKDMAHLERVIAHDPALQQFIQANRYTPATRPVRLTTDDWPYLYVEKAAIPSLHLCLSIILIGLFVGFRFRVMPKKHGINWHFFFLGAAFLLLEFQNISKTTLLFGSTWMVSAFTISAILLLILLANRVAAKFQRIDTRKIYLCLLVSIAIAYTIPLSVFNVLPFLPKVVIASTVLNIPIFFAGIVFITSFRNAKHAHVAFGSNLLGAGLGGVLESVSFITGIGALLVLVGGLYLASFIALKRSGTGT